MATTAAVPASFDDAPAVSEPRTAGWRGRWFRQTGWRHVVGVLALVFALFPVWFVVIAA